MASIRKRTWVHDGATKTAWVVDVTDGSGRRQRRQFRTRKAADAYELKVRTEVDQRGGRPIVTERITVNQALDLFLGHCDDRARVGDRMRAITAEQWRRDADLHLRPEFGDCELQQLSIQKIQQWADRVAFRESKPLGKARIEGIIDRLRGTLDHARSLGFVRANVLREEELRISGRPADRHNIPSKGEIGEMLREADRRWQKPHSGRYWFRPVLYVAVFAGLRLGEIRALRWPAVDLSAGTIEVVAGADWKGRLGDPKSKAGFRSIPIAPPLRTVLREWRLQNPGDGLVFPASWTGGVMSPSMIAHNWYKLLADTVGTLDGKPSNARAVRRRGGKYRFHDLRHACASLWIEAGLPPKRIQHLMGHSSIKMTFDLYGHLFDDDDSVLNAMRNIGSQLRPAGQTEDKSGGNVLPMGHKSGTTL